MNRITKWSAYRKELYSYGNIKKRLEEYNILVKNYKSEIDKINPNILSNLEFELEKPEIVLKNNITILNDCNDLKNKLNLIDIKKIDKIIVEINNFFEEKKIWNKKDFFNKDKNIKKTEFFISQIVEIEKKIKELELNPTKKDINVLEEINLTQLKPYEKTKEKNMNWIYIFIYTSIFLTSISVFILITIKLLDPSI